MPDSSVDSLPPPFVTSPERIALPDAELAWFPDFLDEQTSALLFQRLLQETPWRQDTIRMHGRTLPVPRLQAWYGEPEARYGYSGLQLDPLAFTPLLRQLREQICSATGCGFNSALLNHYRDGSDSVSWHSDDEKELGPDPLIASLSLGITRRFELKHRKRRDLKKLSLELHNGSLLLMGAGTQCHWLHQIPKQRGLEGARINLTFRLVAPVAQ